MLNETLIMKANENIIETDNPRIIDRAMDAKNDCRHLCWDCENGHVDKCEKIADLEKDIHRYKFIKRGYQLNRSMDGKLVDFMVIECDNFQHCDSKRNKPSQEWKKAAKSLRLFYFNGDIIRKPYKN